ncbi:histone-lysine N-methyltransferase SETMAR-like [Ptiloglossa arizonensis]|uniref:histone-lysine N-methyltransferase SETMAR-like n=1 Tax=Ptiloglossa arizonensis TaxID=3350558 RepID=UPI003FA06177
MRHALELKISQKTVWNHLHKATLKKKLDVWVPHKMIQKNLLERIDAGDSLLKRNEIDPFSKRMVTGDEKWITYENNRRKISWSKRGEPAQTIAKLGLTTKKRSTRSVQNWLIGRVVFHQDNARPYTSSTTCQKLRELGWEVISHPLYSPDLAPSDYHFFKHLQHFLDGKKLTSKEACENVLVKFFTNRNEDFFNRGIMKLPSKWTKKNFKVMKKGKELFSEDGVAQLNTINDKHLN